MKQLYVRIRDHLTPDAGPAAADAARDYMFQICEDVFTNVGKNIPESLSVGSARGHVTNRNN